MNKPNAKSKFYLHFCRGEVSKTKSKITNKPNAKANFYCILPRRSIQNEVKDTKNSPFHFVKGEKATTARFVRKIHQYRTCSLPLLTKRSGLPVPGTPRRYSFENTTGQPSGRGSHRIVRDRAPSNSNSASSLKLPRVMASDRFRRHKVPVLRISARIGRAPETDAVHRLIPVTPNAVIGHIRRIEAQCKRNPASRSRRSPDDPVQYIRFRIVTIHPSGRKSIDPNGIERHSPKAR